MAGTTKASPEHWRMCRIAWELSSAVTFGAIASELAVSRQAVSGRAQREGWRGDLRGDAAIFTHLLIDSPERAAAVDTKSAKNEPHDDPVAALSAIVDSLRAEVEFAEALLLIERIRSKRSKVAVAAAR